MFSSNAFLHYINSRILDKFNKLTRSASNPFGKKPVLLIETKFEPEQFSMFESGNAQLLAVLACC